VRETSEGTIAYYSSQVRAATVGPLGTTWLVSLSFHVTKGAFVLPTKVPKESPPCRPASSRSAPRRSCCISS
jgi:hypothetical protein